MTNFLIGFNAVMPMVLYMVLGQFFSRSKLVSQEAFSQFNRALFGILLPINLFANVYNTNIAEDFDPDTLIYVLLYAVGIFIVSAIIVPLLEKDNRKRGVIVQGAIRSNAILFGLPLGISLLGEDNMGMVSIVLATIVPLNNILSVVALSIYSDAKLSLKQIGKNIITNPMVIFTLAGILVQILNIQFPIFMETAMNNLSRMVSPLALLVMGGTFNFSKLKEAGWPLIGTVATKLVINPAIAFLIGGYVLGFRGASIVAILIATAGPTAVSSFAQAEAAGGDGDLANQIVVFTTVLSMFTLVAWIFLLKTWGYF
ncbi:hypothetical protein SAMN04487985_104113 [Aerococcus urinaehominis]|uniref:AEC family transporter n=1 Tax=Aerococcus urinaehominis TaxID=128944 RepID=UPI0008859771|nr:AEC family transporter [Aerococcus urinaehominis]SDM06362.1 hypothetical protein SAMN04487985_104113 [Aerococcus urinaehominis]